MTLKIIYWLGNLFFYLCTAFVIFVLVGSILSYFEYNNGLDVPFITISADNSQTEIVIPFTKMHIGFQNSYTVIILWLSLLFYAFYFFTLSKFFKLFTGQTVFTKASVKILNLFLVLNLVPLVGMILYSLIELFKGNGFKMDSEYLLVAVHLIVSILVYLYLELIKKGKIVKDENDLTI